MTSEILARYHATQIAIQAACSKAGRPPDSVSLVVVSKTQRMADIEPLLLAGHRVFGENRVQEAKEKWSLLKTRYADIELHLIGPLQSNKAAEAVALFDVIETVDRDRIVDALAVEMKKQGRTPRLLVQVNTGREAQKAGLSPEALPAFLARLQNADMRPEGLMCIPPVNDSPAKHFTELRALAGAAGLKLLSMGMSSDYGQAIACGATHIRVGSAIFGARS